MTAPLRVGAVVVALGCRLRGRDRTGRSELAEDRLLWVCGRGQLCEVGPADTPLFIQSGFSSGTRGLVESATSKTQNTFSVTYSAGGGSTFLPAFEAPQQNPDGTWTAMFTADFPPLASGDSMTIRWTYTVSQPFQELVPPSSDWDPEANFQPPWDGTGLKYTNFAAAGVYNLGTCTVTAV